MSTSPPPHTTASVRCESQWQGGKLVHTVPERSGPCLVERDPL